MVLHDSESDMELVCDKNSFENASISKVQELCESRGGPPGLSVLNLMSLTVSVHVKQH